jgi:hypothetical protein
VFNELKGAITATPSLHGKLRFVTLSFDPARDTPNVMLQYADSRVSEEDEGLHWYFLTTRSARELMPLVDGFGQDINITFDRSSGRPRLVLNDIQTLLIEEDPRRSRAAVKK